MTFLSDAFTIALAVGGILAYRGVWRSWAFHSPGYGVGFMLLYVAIAFGAGRISVLLLPLGGMKWLAAVFLFIAIGSMILALVSLIWLPKFLLPTWFRTVRGR